MKKVLENVVPQASNLDKEENLAIVSDRVKAPVGGAGSTDFGGSQKHDVVNQAGEIGVDHLAPNASQKTSDEEEGGSDASAAHTDHFCGGCGTKYRRTTSWSNTPWLHCNRG